MKELILWHKRKIVHQQFMYNYISGPGVIKLFSCSTQLSMKFIVLINVKMPTIVLSFMSKSNATSEIFNARKIFIFHHFIFYEQLKFHAQLS